MAAEGYLPPVVTKFLADLTDLAKGVAAGKMLMADFADTTTESMRLAGGEAGRAYAHQFTTEIRAGTQVGLRSVALDAANVMGDESAKSMAGAGAKAASSFGSSFSSMLIPILVASLVLLSPVIVTGIASAITLGIGLGFVGLGAFLLREQKTLVDAAVNFKNTISAVFKDAATPMLGPLVAGLNILTGVVKELGPSFKEIFAAIGPAIPAFAQGIGGFFRELMPGLKALAPVAADIITAFGKAMPDIGKGLGDFLKSLAESGPGMVLFIEDLGKGLGDLLTNLGKATVFFSDLYEKLSAFRDKAVEGGWDTPWAAIATGVEKAGEFISGIGKDIGEWFSGTADDVGKWFDDTWADIEAWGGKVGDWFAAIPGKIGDALAALPGKFADAVVAGFDAFFYWTAFGITKVVQALIAFPFILVDITKRAWNGAVEWFNRGVDETVSAAQSFPGKVSKFFDELGDKISAWATKTYRDTVQWIHKTIDDVVGWIQGLPERGGKALGEFTKRAKDWALGAKDWLVDAGKDLITGLIKGVDSMIDWGVRVVERAAERIKDGFKAAMGIDSPSKVFALYGLYTVQGYVQGIQSNQGMVSGAWRSMLGGGAGAPRVTADMRPAAVAASSGGGSAMLHATFNIDGQRFMTAIVPVAQDRKRATGSTGLT